MKLALWALPAVVLVMPVTPSPSPDATQVAASSVVVAAVGDIACDPADPRYRNGDGTAIACAQSRTSDALLAEGSVVAVLGLGDYQYDCGDPADYNLSYDPTWGRLNALMRPSAGNHEYKTGTDKFGAACPPGNASAQSYFTYFASAAHAETSGHFSFDVGDWHLVALNGNCKKTGVGGCAAGSSQTAWLKSDLAATSQPCLLAYWHQPLFTGLGQGKAVRYRPWWEVLYGRGADVVLNGHTHNYQRFAPRQPGGGLDAAGGITQYVVGTGGEEQIAVHSTATPQPAYWRKGFGYLRLTLGPGNWTGEFVDETGSTLDRSTGVCRT